MMHFFSKSESPGLAGTRFQNIQIDLNLVLDSRAPHFDDDFCAVFQNRRVGRLIDAEPIGSAWN